RPAARAPFHATFALFLAKGPSAPDSAAAFFSAGIGSPCGTPNCSCNAPRFNVMDGFPRSRIVTVFAIPSPSSARHHHRRTFFPALTHCSAVHHRDAYHKHVGCARRLWPSPQQRLRTEGADTTTPPAAARSARTSHAWRLRTVASGL